MKQIYDITNLFNHYKQYISRGESAVQIALPSSTLFWRKQNVLLDNDVDADLFFTLFLGRAHSFMPAVHILFKNIYYKK